MGAFSWPRRSLSALALLGLSFAWSQAAFGQGCPGDNPSAKPPFYNVCDQGGSTPPALSADTKVFVVYWGSEWSNGFACPGSLFFGLACSFAYQNYLETFLKTILGTAGHPPSTRYLSILRQYDDAGGSVERFSPDNVWIDPSEPPATTDVSTFDDAVRAEAHKAQVHFGDNNPDIIVMVLPRNVIIPKLTCGYHRYASSPTVYYAVIPFPAINGCVPPVVNVPGDTFGHGLFDGLSIITGHELAETLTDPGTKSFQDATGVGGEVGDKCQSSLSNIGDPVTGVYFAVQALWSDEGSGCFFGDSPHIKAPRAVDFGIYFVGAVPAPMTVNFQNDGTRDFPLGGHWLLSSSTGPFEPVPGSADHCEVLHPRDSCAIQMLFVADNPIIDQTETLTFVDNDGNPFASVTLKGGALQRPGVNWLPPGIFGPTLVGPDCDEHCPMVQGMMIVNQDSSPHRVINISLGTLAAANAAVTGTGAIGVPDFTIVNDACSGVTLQPGRSCTVSIGFVPQETGQRFGLVNFLDETGAPHSAMLAGIGWGPSARLAGPNLSELASAFPSSHVLGVTQVEQVTLTAGGQAPLNISSIKARGDFQETNDCPSMLALGASCTINVKLTPSHYGFQTGDLTIDDDASDSPQVVRLSGAATATLALASPSKLRFGCQPVNVASEPLKVELATLEGGAFRISSIMTSGDFVESTDCPSSLTSFCTISVVFKPSRTGKETGRLTIFTDAVNGIQSVGLSGIGTRVEDRCEHMRVGERGDCEQQRKIEECGERGDK